MMVFFVNFASMNNNTVFALLLAIASGLVLCQSCNNGTPRYDTRLIHADSLLQEHEPDSALLLLSAIDGATLPAANDRAYHALLLTQAQYRCYADITSDSTINVALDYYQRHSHERDKLTRSYIYKGAVTEVLGAPERAMTYYKQAVSVAPADDHCDLGYALLRIGCLYRDFLVTDSSDVTTIKQALYHFEHMPDSAYILHCLSCIGSSYIDVNDDSALVYLERADTLAKAIGDKYLEITNLRYIADLKIDSHDPSVVNQVKNTSLASLASDYCPPEERTHLLLIAAHMLAKLNRADSASLYMDQVNTDSLSDGLCILYNLTKAEVALCHGNVGQYQYYYERADHISDSLERNDTQRQLREVEAKYDNEVLRNKSQTYKSNWIVSLLGTALFAVALLAVIMAMRRRLKQHQRQVEESMMTIERLRADAATLTSQLGEHQAMSDELKQAIQDQIGLFTQLVEKHVTQYANSPNRFSKAFAQAYLSKQPDSRFWKALRTYVNARYNDIIDTSLATYPSLNETDVRYLALYCCNLPTSVIMACMGYKEAHSAYNKKRRVAAAVESPASLDAYIEMFK